MNEIIRKRKSIRKFDLTKLDTATLNTVRMHIDSITPLFGHIPYSIEIAENGKIHCYRKKANSVFGSFTNKLSSIDMGIALCHIAQESKGFHFAQDPDPPVRKGCIYTGTIS